MELLYVFLLLLHVLCMVVTLNKINDNVLFGLDSHTYKAMLYIK